MAHEISIQNGRAEIAYTGEMPWHGLGTRVDGLQTAQEMIGHAGLDWAVGLHPLLVSFPDDDVSLQGWSAIVREDTRQTLGITSPRYQPIQNTQCADVVDALIAEGGARIEVAGALGNGERCWMLAQLPGEFEVVRGDAIRPYFLLAWGHDGKHGIAGKLTPIRVVCSNTLAAAGLGRNRWSTASDIYIRHYGNPKLNIEEARQALGLVRKQIEETQEAFQSLTQPVTNKQAQTYFATVFPADNDVLDQEKKLARWQSHQDRLFALFESGVGTEIASTRGTAWAAYNAVTEWLDHVYPMLKSGRISRTRQQSVLFGLRHNLRQHALTKAFELV